MKSIFRIAIAIAVALFVALNTFTYVPPGTVGVLVKRTGGGIAEQFLSVGFKFRWPILQEVIVYPVHMQTLILTKSDKEGGPDNDEIVVNSIEGQPVSCDVSLSFELDSRKVPSLYQAFRTDIESIKHGFVKQTIRQAMQEVVGKTEIVNFLGKDKATIVNAVQADIQRRLGDYGFLVKQFTMNEIRPPQSIVTAIEAKNAMQQDALRSEQELKKKQFEAQQKVAEAEGDAQSTLKRAEAQAKANQLLSASINPTLVEYQRVMQQAEAIKKWSGTLPQYMMGNAVPFVNLPPTSAK